MTLASQSHITTRWRGLRWAMLSKVSIASLISKVKGQKAPSESKGYAHARAQTHTCASFFGHVAFPKSLCMYVCVCLFVCVDCWCFDANYFLVSMMFEGHMTENDFDSSFHANIRTSVIRKHAAFDACQLFTNAMYMINL